MAINSKRIVMLSPTMSQPRYHRRAAMFLQAGYDVTVYAFSRGLYEDNTYPDNTEVVTLGNVESGKYLSRIPQLLKAIFIINKNKR